MDPAVVEQEEQSIEPSSNAPKEPTATPPTSSRTLSLLSNLSVVSADSGSEVLQLNGEKEGGSVESELLPVSSNTPMNLQPIISSSHGRGGSFISVMKVDKVRSSEKVEEEEEEEEEEKEKEKSDKVENDETKMTESPVGNPGGPQPATKDELQTWIKEYDGGVKNHGEPNSWDVTLVTDMSALFKFMKTFDSPIDQWDTSKVTDMSCMFQKASSFNQPIMMDTSKVTDMSDMFYSASSFNQPITMDTSKVMDMSGMFQKA